MRGVLNSSERTPSLDSTNLDPPVRIGKDQTEGSPKSLSDKARSNASVSNHDGSHASASYAQFKVRDEQGQGIPESSQQSKSSSDDNLSASGFHVFTWLKMGKLDHGTSSPTINARQLKEDLKTMDRFLSRETSLRERIAYTECPPISRPTVYALLEQETRSTSSSATNDQGAVETKRKTLEHRIDIANAAESIFQFFFPSTYEGPTLQKYWGGLHQLLLV